MIYSSFRFKFFLCFFTEKKAKRNGIGKKEKRERKEQKKRKLVNKRKNLLCISAACQPIRIVEECPVVVGCCWTMEREARSQKEGGKRHGKNKINKGDCC
jgi:hypothetical protein